MLPDSKTQEMLLGKPCFCKSLSLRENWKSKSMRIIPEDFVRQTHGAFEHRVVLSVSWGNSWQLWLQRDKKGFFMLKEDWDEFVDDNLLRPNDTLLFTHQDTMFLQVRIFDKDGEEIISAPLQTETKSQLIHIKPLTTLAFASSSGGTNGRARRGCDHVKNPERYLLDPKNPYFVKTLMKKIDVLYVRQHVIDKYDLKFGPHNSTMSYHLPNGEKHDAFTKIYGSNLCFSGWAALCRKYNLKQGDNLVCELERSGGVVTAVRLHFVI